AEPIAPARTGAARAAAAPSPAPRATASTPATTAPSTGGATGDQYTVKPGDTLAKIAGQFKPNDVTLDQMLIAFFNGNPNAFDEQNINRLRRGAIMNVPTATEIGRASCRERGKIWVRA